MKTPLATTMFLALTLISAPAMADDHRPGTPPARGTPPQAQDDGRSSGPHDPRGDGRDDDHHDGRAYGHDDDHHDGRAYGHVDDHRYGPHDGRGGPGGYAVSGVSLANQAGVEVSVWVDGTFRGSVRANDTRTFSELPGLHQVVARGADGCVLYNSAVSFTPRGLGYVQVVPPFAIATLFNQGSTPLYVTAGTTSLWILPGTRQDVRVPNGCSHVFTSIVGPRGSLIAVGDYELRATGGQRLVQEIGWTPPPRLARTVLTNHEPTTVRIYIDNREVLTLRPGQTASLDLIGGRHQVLVTEARGRVLFNAGIDVRAGSQSEVDIWRGVRIHSARGTYIASR